MPVAFDLMMLTIDSTRAPQLNHGRAQLAMGGALVTDLVVAERCEVEERRREARFRLVSNRSLGSPAHDLAMARMTMGKAVRGSALVRQLGQRMPAMVLDQLAAHGAVAVHTQRTLRVFTSRRVEVLDTARRDWLAGAVHRVLLGHAPPDEVTGPLVGLLAASGRIGELVDPVEQPAALARARAIVNGDWAASATRRAVIRATQTTSEIVWDHGGGGDGGDGGDSGGGDGGGGGD